MTASDKRLSAYLRKRDFSKSPEPAGDGSRRHETAPAFVIQQHRASTLHFDFRLEIDGVLVSWVVPKGPSTDPREKRLAIRTEDHPLDYADFEGTIPEDQYGGGTVLVWDAGPYRNLLADKDDGARSMQAALDDGHVEVWLEGEKLKGGYGLIHARAGGEEANWLLVKMNDDEADARRNPVSTEPRSVLSGRTLDEVAASQNGREQ